MRSVLPIAPKYAEPAENLRFGAVRTSKNNLQTPGIPSEKLSQDKQSKPIEGLPVINMSGKNRPLEKRNFRFSGSHCRGRDRFPHPMRMPSASGPLRQSHIVEPRSARDDFDQRLDLTVEKRLPSQVDLVWMPVYLRMISGLSLIVNGLLP